MHKYHLFDLDGTLVDSMPNWANVMLHILDEFGVSYPSDIIKIVTPLGLHGTAEHFLSLGLKVSSIDELKKIMYEKLIYEYENSVFLKSGAKEYLENLKSKGYKLFVLTASPHRTTDVCLQNNGVFSLFEKVWSTDDFSFNKADKRIYKEVCDRIGCKPQEICFYDDNLTNIRTAKSAGIYTVGVYDLSSDDHTAEIKKTADEYRQNF